ncbi:hypothetical protein Goklo_007778 [Gossypium klotzschianum]|uniref:DYW domain-containing protein n=1 Tax=Gossypium klotzschianum TaxID=34286 RepID=A0A7J8UXL9_9ROSI|nr:hypothetical protein [Gossypium klotzschianum]
MGEGRELLDEMKVKDVLVWTTLVSGYDQWGDLESANEMLEKNQLCCVCACASIASLPHGRQIHACLIQTNFRPNMIVVSSLVGMYSKCDCLKCRGSEMFDNMVKMGVKPDRTGPLLLLWSMHVASHSGLVQVGGAARFDQLMNHLKLDSQLIMTLERRRDVN